MESRNPKIFLIGISVALAIIAILNGSSSYGQGMTDPYEILAKNLEMSGGLARLKALRTLYLEGDLSVGGMSGSIKIWTEKPDRSRAEIQIGPLSMIQGDNGEIRWVLDTNGRLQVITKSDEATLKRREIERKMAEYEYADPGSEVFSVSFEDTQQVDGTECYVIKITNGINTDYHIYYISVDDFRLVKDAAIQGENSADTYYGDYRKVDGIELPFYIKEIPYQTGQPQEITVTLYESNPDIEPGSFEPPEAGGKDYEFMRGRSSENIPFKFIGNHLYIPVTMAGRERLWVLDTGAAMTVADKAFADEMGLELEGDLKGVGAGGTVDASFTVLPPFELEGIQFQKQTAAVIDMSELIRRLGIDIAGILGFDFLSRFVTRVDYAGQTVSFYDPETFVYSGHGKALDAHIEESVFETQAVLDGKHSGTWLFDLGAGTTHLDAAHALREGYADKHGVISLGHGAGNEYQLKTVKCDSIRIGGFTLYHPFVTFNYGGTDTTFRADRMGVLGNTVFRNFVVYVDYDSEQVILEKGEKFNWSWPEDRSGLGIGWTPDRGGVEVLFVSPGTPAEQSGFVEGDILEAIDGEVIDPADGVISVRELLKEEPGTVHKIVVDRSGRQIEMKLTLEDLYQ